MPTVADTIVEIIRDAGVKRVYGIPGDSLNGFTDALRRAGDVTWEHVRHEEAAAFAAAAEAALTGELAVCAGSCGPGNLHLINGLFDANRSRVPVLAIAAQIPGAEIGSTYFQETHPQDLFREASVYSEIVSMPEQLPRILEIAMRTAVERRGVAVVVIPGEIFLADAAGRRKSAPIAYSPRVTRPSDAELDAAAQILNGAKKVTILAGAGAEGAHGQLIDIAGALKAPVVHALRGKEFVEYDNPFDVGMTGLIGFSSGYHAMEDCDTLLMLGTDFPYRQFYPEDAKVAQVDIRPGNIGRRCRVDLGIVGDVGETLRALLPRIEPKRVRGHLDRCLAHYARARHDLDELARIEPGHDLIHPQQVTRLVSELAEEDAVFTCDVGTPTIWAARYLRMNGKRRLLGSWVHGSMACAMPQAIGAQAAFPDRQVISLSGDGGFAMLMGDFITLAQQKLPVKVIVLNNGTLGFVELEMKAAGLLETGVELQNPDFAAMANAMGIHGRRVARASDLPSAIAEVLAHEGPALLDVVSNRLELSIPPKISGEQVKGLSLYALKAVMSGRGDSIVDLALSNLSR